VQDTSEMIVEVGVQGHIQDFYNGVSISIPTDNILVIALMISRVDLGFCKGWDRYKKKQLHSVQSTLSSCKACAYLGGLGPPGKLTL